MPRVIIGMSGGVDSSVAAYLLKEKGYEVEGISFVMWDKDKGIDTESCCSPKAVRDVSQTADHIGISCRTIDAKADFMEKVVKPFVSAYLSGVTPNPCVLCNRFIKFPFLMKEAERRGAEYISTGHYAKIEPAKDNPPQADQRTRGRENMQQQVFSLKKGTDPKKDQSYVLYVLTQEELGRLILPLGNFTKSAVRKIAEELHMKAAERSESQEICFIEGRNYLRFIEQLSPVVKNPGPIVGPDGKVIGTHKGIHGYTLGQRKGMGVSSREPLYVVDIDMAKNTVYAGPREAAKKREFFVGEPNWIVPPPQPSAGRDKERLEFRWSVKVRSTMKDQPATIYVKANPPLPPFAKGGAGGLLSETVRVVFDEPQWAPAPGQSAVFYDNDTVIGGGVIKRSA
jgi:tRNA-specific 2-thiouridylase